MTKSNDTGGSATPRRRKGGGAAAVAAAIEGAMPALSGASVSVFGFEMRQHGLFKLKTADRPEFRICGHFEVLAYTRDDLQCAWGLLLRWRDHDGKPHEWIMPGRLLAGEAVELRARLLSSGLHLETHADARAGLLKYLSSVRPDARVRTVPTVGWYRQEDGRAAFILPDQQIGQLLGEVVRLDVDPPPTIYRARGSVAGWRDEVASRCIGNSRLTFGVSCGFAGALLPLLEDEGGGFNVVGGSSTGKTTVVDAGATVWGSPTRTGPRAFTRLWRTTETALEGTAAVHNHTLLPMDEMGEVDAQKLPGILYMLSNGTGRARGLPGGGQRAPVNWQILVLSSSEENAAKIAEQAGVRFKAGQEVRMVHLRGECVAGGRSCFETLHGAADGSAFQQDLRKAFQENYGAAGPAFVAHLADRLARAPDWIAESVRERVASWSDSVVPPGADGQVRRAARRFATVAIAGELATEAGITGWPVGAAAAAAGVLFRDWIAERGGTGNREDHYLKVAFRRFLRENSGGRFSVVPDKTEDDAGAQTEPPLPAGDRILKRAGWRWQEADEAGERHYVHAVFPEVFDTEIAGQLGMDGNDARARLGRLGLIRGKREGDEMRWAWKVKKFQDGSRPRMMVAERAAFDD